MLVLFSYVIKVSLSLGLVYLFYRLILQNLTFYNWKRWYLLGGVVGSFLVPLMPALPWFKPPTSKNLTLILHKAELDGLVDPILKTYPDASTWQTYWVPLLVVIYVGGLIFLTGRLIVQAISFYQIKRAAVRLPEWEVPVYQVNLKIAPFSFGNGIYLNKNLLQPAEIPAIICHEKVHIDQHHTNDALLLAGVCLLNWFNPLAWRLQRVARQNLEFIADRAVISEPTIDKKFYQYLLLKVNLSPVLTIANQFNVSDLQSRIIMMNKMPSNHYQLTRFLLVLPLAATLLVACQTDTDSDPPKAADYINQQVQAGESGNKPAPPPPPEVPPVTPPPPPPPPVVRQQTSSEKLFMKHNPQVEMLGWQGLHTLVVFLKTGEREEYHLNDLGSKVAAQKKYGTLPLDAMPQP